jgi:hypothetical protein
MHSAPISTNWAGKDSESILWLASYPRSGNTFTRILLANYFLASEEDYDINKLSAFIPADTSALLWNDFAAVLPSPCSSEITWKNRPKVLDHYRRLGKAVPFFGLKTHTANVETFGCSGFNFRAGDRAIYIVRHPLDVLLSYSDFNGRDRDSAIEVMCTSGTTVQHEPLGAMEVRGSWQEHVSSWLSSPPCPLLLVRYEELCMAPEETLGQILGFLGTPIYPERVRSAVEASRFDKLRAQETVRSFRETPSTSSSGAFFRKGKILQWLKELTPAQAYRLADNCAEVMERLGYTHPRDVFFDGRNAIKRVNLAG